MSNEGEPSKEKVFLKGANPMASVSAMSILDAIDNPEIRFYFMQLLGYSPTVDKKGRVVGWSKKDEVDYDEATLALLQMMSAKRNTAIANLENVSPISGFEVELMTDLAWVLHELMLPEEEDVLKYIPAEVWAKLELYKGLSLADGGLLIKSLMGVPMLPAGMNPPIPASNEEPKKSKGFFDKLFGRR